MKAFTETGLQAIEILARFQSVWLLASDSSEFCDNGLASKYDVE